MRHLSITPSITVTIGRHTRLYFAFITTAPADLDSPATMTLHAGTFADIVGFAAESFVHDDIRARTPARLVLVDALELAWQRARYQASSIASTRTSRAGVRARISSWTHASAAKPTTSANVPSWSVMVAGESSAAGAVVTKAK